MHEPCDFCSTDMEFLTVDLEFGYGSKFDGDNKQFCSDECLYTWLKENLIPSAKTNKTK